MAYIIRKEETCLECGESLNGRKGKKFCCLSCKNSYNNRKYQEIRKYKAEIINRLSRNYEILESLLNDNSRCARLDYLSSEGFDPACFTGVHKTGKHLECSCFDISYYKTESRIFNISRKMLNGHK